MTGTKRTEGPWVPFQAITEPGKPWGAQRSIRHRLYTCEQLKVDGKPARFSTEGEARAAIAKAS